MIFLDKAIEVSFVQNKQVSEDVGDPQRCWYKKPLSGKIRETKKLHLFPADIINEITNVLQIQND